jgi:lipopolysaccharide/colanic/teichoic acid biosynthesis glycosyltransferase
LSTDSLRSTVGATGEDRLDKRPAALALLALRRSHARALAEVLAWVCVGAPAAVAAFVGGSPWPEAVGVGVCAAALFMLLERFERPPEWRRLRAANFGRRSEIRNFMIVSLVLTASLELFGFGLQPVEAIAASIAAGALLLVARRLGAKASTRILVVGAGEVGQLVVRRLSERRHASIVAVLDNDPPAEAGAAGTVGRLEDLREILAREEVDLVVVAFASGRDHEIVKTLRACRAAGVAVSVVSRMFQELDRRAGVRRVGGIPLIEVEPSWRERIQPRGSRLLDLSIGIFASLLALPILIAIALAVVIESGGPVLYRARRVGVGGREFDMLKFRKMRADAGGARLTVASDERLTRVGRFLLATKLDELPQLWNVICGDMALVGPRPEDPGYVAFYPDEFREILSVRPGITGLTQIQYRHEQRLLVGPDFEEQYRNVLLPEKISIDRYYAERRSIGLDLKILGWTVVAILRGAELDRCPVTDSLTFRGMRRP